MLRVLWTNKNKSLNEKKKTQMFYITVPNFLINTAVI